MPNESVVQVENVSKDFVLAHERVGSIKSIFTNALKRKHSRAAKIQHALRDISFEVRQGEFFGVVGRNGSGKSTLLKILAGIYQPTSGKVFTRGKLVPFIELGVGFNPELTGRENVYLNGAMLGFSKKEIEAMYREIVEFAELEKFMDQKLKNYSSGMQVRLAFSMATRSEADILLVDEVLAVGDADFQKKCYKYFKSLKKNQKTVIFVSHDMQAVEEYCDRAVLIEDSKIVVEGTAHDVANAYTRMFLEQNQKKGSLSQKKRRWGTSSAEYVSVATNPAKIKDDKVLNIEVVAKVKKDITEAIFGFKIRDEEDNQLIGSNTKLKHQDQKGLAQKDKVVLNWSVPNIFNTGNYFVDLAIQNEDYSEVYDWWEGAATFQVERSEPNPYPTHPLIDLAIRRER